MPVDTIVGMGYPGPVSVQMKLLVTPGPVVAGCFGSWTIELTVGSLGIDEGGTIKLAQRYASDWQRPQFDRPTEPGYTTVRTTGQAKLAPRFERKGHVTYHIYTQSH